MSIIIIQWLADISGPTFLNLTYPDNTNLTIQQQEEEEEKQDGAKHSEEHVQLEAGQQNVMSLNSLAINPCQRH
jgi:hypothetical protein